MFLKRYAETKDLILERRPINLPSLVHRTSKCDLQFKNSLLVIPKYHTAGKKSKNFYPWPTNSSKIIFLVKGFCGALNNTILVLLVFKAILLLLSIQQYMRS